MDLHNPLMFAIWVVCHHVYGIFVAETKLTKCLGVGQYLNSILKFPVEWVSFLRWKKWQIPYVDTNDLSVFLSFFFLPCPVLL